MENQGTDQINLQSNRLALLGKISLNQRQNKTINKSRPLLQQVNNDQQFKQIPNIITTYIPVDNKDSKTIIKSDKKQSSFKQTQRQPQRHPPRKESPVYNPSKSIKTYNNKFNSSTNNNFKNNQLQDIQSIIQQIQEVMDSTSPSQKPSIIKNDKFNTNKKKNWQKGKMMFNKQDAFSKLQEMLLNYNINSQTKLALKQQQIDKKQKKQDKMSNRRNRNQQRLNRNKAYNQISKSLNDKTVNDKTVNDKTVNDNKIVDNKMRQNDKTKENDKIVQDKIQLNLKQKDRENQSQMQFQSQNKIDQQIDFQNVLIMQIDWLKLPLVLSHITSQNINIFLQIKDFPVQQTFYQAISQSLSSQKTYNSYSIFNPNFQAGIITSKSKNLISQQQFRQKWAQQWSLQIQDQSHKQMLCQFDLHWYRNLIQHTYKSNLQDILIKNIQYDINKYINNLNKINNKKNNDKNMTIVKQYDSLISLININKIEYVSYLLNKSLEVKKSKKHKLCMVGGIITKIHQNIDKDTLSIINNHIQDIGGRIYQYKNIQQSLAIMIKISQSVDINYRQNHIEIKQLNIYINQEQNIKEERYILIKSQKKKERMMLLKVKQRTKDEVEIEVGEETYFGRNYYILLD